MKFVIKQKTLSLIFGSVKINILQLIVVSPSITHFNALQPPNSLISMKYDVKYNNNIIDSYFGSYEHLQPSQNKKIGTLPFPGTADRSKTANYRVSWVIVRLVAATRWSAPHSVCIRLPLHLAAVLAKIHICAQSATAGPPSDTQVRGFFIFFVTVYIVFLNYKLKMGGERFFFNKISRENQYTQQAGMPGYCCLV